jgi:alkanesulfonate monooxygenase SsuD/methylene tetrahydromethanopterin reductase-like flavin-dependent oxidoreductase (luciferase family)
MTVTHPIRFGVFTGVAQTPWRDLLEAWQRIDAMGFDTAWVPDHFYAGYGDPEGPCFEAGTALAALAARTRRIGVGPLVFSNTFRHPAVVANMAASLDHVAEGRFTLGLGAGWLQSEHDGYALLFGTARDRIERLDEALTVIRLLHTERRASFGGRSYRLDDALCEPKPCGGRRLPILLGGGGERLMLRVVAKHADEWNGEVGPSAMGRKLDILREHCRAVGRDPADIRVSVVLRSEAQAEAMWEGMIRMNNPNLLAERRRLETEGVSAASLDARLREWAWESFFPVDEDRAVDRLHAYVTAGVTHFIVASRPPYDLAGLERFLTRVAARVRA